MNRRDRSMKLKTGQGIVLGLFAYGVLGYFNSFAEKNQILQYPTDNPPLYDRLHNVLPVFPKIYPDVLAVGLVTYFVLRWGFKYPKVLENYIWILVILFVGRVLTFTMTQFPPSRPGCSTRREGDKIIANPFPKNWQACRDMMYSGHTFHTLLILLFVLYLSKSYAEKTIVFMLVILELILVIGSRSHYSCDVFVGSLVTILIFYAWPGADQVLRNIVDGGIYGIMLTQTHNLKNE